MEAKFKGRLERGRSGAARVLNSIAAVTEHALEHKADQMHAEILMKDKGIDDGVASDASLRRELVQSGCGKRELLLSRPVCGDGGLEVHVEAGGARFEKREVGEVLEGRREGGDRVQIPDVAGESGCLV